MSAGSAFANVPPSRRRRGAGRRFLVIGDVLDGVIVTTSADRMGTSDPDAVVRTRPSGQAANTAAWLGWLGVHVDFVGRVGVDDVYRHGLALTNAGVTPHLGYDRSDVTGVIVAVHAPHGEVTMTDESASGRLDLRTVDQSLLAHADVVHLAGDGLFHASEPRQLAALVRRATDAGARVSVRPPSDARITSFGAESLLDALDGVDVLLPTGPEALALTGSADPVDAAGRLTERVPLVIVTLAKAGVLVARRGRTPQTVPGTAVGVVDPTGVDDAFAAGFLSAWATDPVRFGAAAREGVRVAARSLAMIGPRPV
jgi:sugar/nucleoside kinase (ribokinase family)